jgi:hypothetical protein
VPNAAALCDVTKAALLGANIGHQRCPKPDLTDALFAGSEAQ